MKIVIIGANDIAFLVAKRLSLEKHDVTVIDHELDRVSYIRDKIDVLAILGYGSDFKILEKAGIYECDVIIALSDIDEVNIVSCTISKMCNVRVKIALINNITIFNSLKIISSSTLKEGEETIMAKELGIDILINSSLKSAEKILNLIKYERLFEFIKFKDMNFCIQGFNIFSDSELCNKGINNIKSIIGLDSLLVLTIIRNGHLIYPVKEDKLLEKDKIYLISKIEDFNKISNAFHSNKNFNPKNMFIMGISDVTESICKNLSENKNGLDIKIFDLDFSKCLSLKRNYSKYENIDVIQGNFTDINFLLEEGLSNVDLFVSVSKKDEKNMISSMISKEYNVKKTIAIIEKVDYLPFISKMGIDVSINPNLLVVMEVLQKVKKYSTILPLDTFEDKNLEIFSFKILKNSKYLNIPISKIDLSEDMLIIAIIRENNCIIPNYNDVLKLLDTVIIFSSIDSINQLNYIFG